MSEDVITALERAICYCVDPGYDGPMNDAIIEITRLRARLELAERSHAELLAACQKLCEEQAYFAKHAREPECMPGNQFYSDKFMAVVRMARVASKNATATTPSESVKP